MRVTKKDFNSTNVQQINSMQLFIVDDIYLYSYKTVIGVYDNGNWYITIHKYSSTTTRQINRFIKYEHFEPVRVSDDNLKDRYNRLKYKITCFDCCNYC